MSACIVRTVVAAVLAASLLAVATAVLSMKLPNGTSVSKLPSLLASLAAATAAASACCAIRIAVFSRAPSALSNATKRTLFAACAAAFCTGVFAPRWLPAYSGYVRDLFLRTYFVQSVLMRICWFQIQPSVPVPSTSYQWWKSVRGTCSSVLLLVYPGLRSCYASGTYTKLPILRWTFLTPWLCLFL
jgi:hypothetical protein